MAIWGIGAHFQGSKPKNRIGEFIAQNRAYIGWKENEAPDLYQMLKSIKPGDIIYV